MGCASDKTESAKIATQVISETQTPAVTTTDTSEPVIATPTEPAPTSRLAAFQLGQTGVQHVIDVTHDSEAATLQKYLKQNGKLQEKLPDELPKFKKESLPAFGIGVLLPGDTQAWTLQYSQSELLMASAIPNHQEIVLHGLEDFSPFYRGVLVLHETRHMHVYLKVHPEWGETWAANDSVDNKTYCYDEADDHRFHNRLFLEGGRSKYREVLDKVVTRLKNAAGAPLGTIFTQNQETGFTYGYPEMLSAFSRDEIIQLGVGLDSAFGPTLSKREWVLRISLLQIHAIFELAEQYSKDPHESQAQYYFWMRSQNNKSDLK